MSGRFSFVLATLLVGYLTSGIPSAEAFLGFGSDTRTEKSGLKFDSGYDVNTVTTISGRVVALPESLSSDNAMIEIRSGNDLLHLILGPGQYWEKNGIPVRINDELTVKGSKAQGLDGKLYVLSEKLINRTTGNQTELRNEKGEPFWSGRNSPSSRTNRSEGRGRGRGTGMMRGGSMRH